MEIVDISICRESARLSRFHIFHKRGIFMSKFMNFLY